MKKVYIVYFFKKLILQCLVQYRLLCLKILIQYHKITDIQWIQWHTKGEFYENCMC